MDNDIPVIAIDGPSASGKGTVARLVAEKLGFHYLDSGLLYRLLAYMSQQGGVTFEDETKLAEIANRLEPRFIGESVFLGNLEVGEQILTETAAAGASRVAGYPLVRKALLEKQHSFRRKPGLVADGRDMGSTVFPDAVLKIFLTASPEERANRRYKQLIEKGMRANLAEILQDIQLRDARDSQRSIAPLQKCVDAELLDSTSLTIDQVVVVVVASYRNPGSHLVPSR